jgi:hypothetical protein
MPDTDMTSVIWSFTDVRINGTEVHNDQKYQIISRILCPYLRDIKHENVAVDYWKTDIVFYPKKRQPNSLPHNSFLVELHFRLRKFCMK